MRIRHIALGVVATAVLACQSTRPTQAVSAAAAAGPSAPVARIGAEVITAGELDTSIRGELNEMEQRTYDLRKSALDQLINQRLVEAKAKVAGKPVDEFLRAELAPKVGEPTDEEARALYERAKAAGQVKEPFDQVKAQIAQFLRRQKSEAVLAQYLEQIRAEAKVEVLLPPYLPAKVEVAATGPSKGPDSAPVTIVEFSDFQCPYCSKAEATVKDLLELEKYKGKLKLVYRDYPLPSHNLAPKAGEAAHCAGDQGKYWEMHDRLFANQKALEPWSPHAEAIGLDVKAFEACVGSDKHDAAIRRDMAEAQKLGISGTPGFLIGRTDPKSSKVRIAAALRGARPFADFKAEIEKLLAEPDKPAEAPPPAKK
jgi:protein-disulfide isomerase